MKKINKAALLLASSLVLLACGSKKEYGACFIDKDGQTVFDVYNGHGKTEPPTFLAIALQFSKLSKNAADKIISNSTIKDNNNGACASYLATTIFSDTEGGETYYYVTDTISEFEIKEDAEGKIPVCYALFLSVSEVKKSDSFAVNNQVITSHDSVNPTKIAL